MKNYFRHLSVICILAMLVTMLCAGCGTTDTKETTAEQNTSETEAGIELSEESAGSSITTLMNTYFTALKKGDVTALSEIMVNAPSKDTVEREIEYVDDYWNIQCYTAAGEEADTWVAYVYYDVKFKNIETAAPSMIREYICTNSDGNLYINNGTVDSEVAEWLESVQSSESVAELLDTVNSELTDAAAQDEDLSTLVSALGIDAEESAEEETTQAKESGSEEATEASESAAEETTKAVESTAEETTKAEESSAEETTKSSSSDYVKFSKKKTMYTKDITNVRKKASTKSKILGRLDEGKKVTALGKKNGFIVIKYGSKKGYIKSGLLTTKKPKTTIKFKARNDKVEARINVKLRKKPSTSAKSAGTLVGGTVVKRTGANSKWTRIKYKGKTYYVATKYVFKKS